MHRLCGYRTAGEGERVHPLLHLSTVREEQLPDGLLRQAELGEAGKKEPYVVDGRMRRRGSSRGKGRGGAAVLVEGRAPREDGRMRHQPPLVFFLDVPGLHGRLPLVQPQRLLSTGRGDTEESLRASSGRVQCCFVWVGVEQRARTASSGGSTAAAEGGDSVGCGSAEGFGLKPHDAQDSASAQSLLPGTKGASGGAWCSPWARGSPSM